MEMIVYFIFGAVLLALDIITKNTASAVLKGAGSLPIWQDVFHLTYLENRGAAFGILQNQRLFFILVAIAVLGAVAFVMYRCRYRSRILNFGVSALAAGTVGNLIDRITKGFVVDFFDFRLIDFPVFNVADICVCVGAALILAFVLFVEDRVSGATKESEADDA